MTTALTPAAAHSSTVAGIVGAGVTMTTSSGTSGQRREVRVGPHAEDAGPLLVDRVDGAAERAADQVPEDGPPDAPLLLRGADDGDRRRGEEALERVAGDAEDVGGRGRCGRARAAPGVVSGREAGAKSGTGSGSSERRSPGGGRGMARVAARSVPRQAARASRADPPPSGGRVSGDGVPSGPPSPPRLEEPMAQVKLGALCWNQYTDWPSSSRPASGPTGSATTRSGRGITSTRSSATRAGRSSRAG